MKVLISGHRTCKLRQYSLGRKDIAIKDLIEYSILELKDKYGYVCGLSGMANGIDLIFCELCQKNNIDYYACPPFEEQEDYMELNEKILRQSFINKARKIYKIRNSQMLEMSDTGIIVWDGNKGGTHNVFQQMLEVQKPFIWIEPKSLKQYKIGF